ncbi:NAD(P)-dependent alcohol dehydrogenase [Gordonia sp. LSe1-13]|uniref:NAD(P)-dependent alcohol dehydrogenase n=1 Tax=Gordonia sesuvii TaxID=3116777 RepID=A0ABU7MF36_9ACTN|nr:NAD(P)-dependent alcohol dehydrogenase [Gordonia sp. LSe1-13]
MKAIVQDRYGGPETLALADVPRPEPAADEVLVEIAAASVNARDWHLMRGDPRIARLDRTHFGRHAPKARIRGTDFAGTVEAVGAEVSDLAAGDEVFGESDGAFAEYVCANRSAVAPKPSNLTFAQAAAVPLAGITALCALAPVRPGQRLLVIGASGGVGTFAVQIGVARGAHVTGVCSTRNVDLVRSLGADVVIDYTRDPVVGSFGVVVDLAGTRSLRTLRRLLAADGTLVLCGGGAPNGDRISVLGPIKLIAAGHILGRLIRQTVEIPTAHPDRAMLAELTELIESGQVRPAIDRTYALTDVPAAIDYMETAHPQAKLVIDLNI